MTEKETWLNVTGMSCASCVKHVGSALREVSGVSEVDVRLEEGKVLVRHDVRTPTQALVEAVADAGYEASTPTS